MSEEVEDHEPHRVRARHSMASGVGIWQKKAILFVMIVSLRTPFVCYTRQSYVVGVQCHSKSGEVVGHIYRSIGKLYSHFAQKIPADDTHSLGASLTHHPYLVQQHVKLTYRFSKSEIRA